MLPFGALPPEAAGAKRHPTRLSPGDSMWKIAWRYQIGISELIQAIADPESSMIYVGQKINIPALTTSKLWAAGH
jgi:LysM repeat protein